MTGQRLDKWLVVSRLVKTRSRAEALIDGATIRLNGLPVTKASTAVKTGDHLEVVIGRWRRTLTVLGAADRRGPASEARELYEETAPPVEVNAWAGAFGDEDEDVR